MMKQLTALSVILLALAAPAVASDISVNDDVPVSAFGASPGSAAQAVPTHEQQIKSALKAYVRYTMQVDDASIYMDELKGPSEAPRVGARKYFAWLQIYRSARLDSEGAVRLVVVDDHLEVTNYMTKPEIQASKATVATIFPPAVIPQILSRAEVWQ